MTRSSGQGGRSRHVSESLEETPEPQKKSKSKSRERSVSESPEPRKKSKSKSHRHSTPVPQNYFSRHSSPVPQKYSNRRHSALEPQKIYVIESSPESLEPQKNLKARNVVFPRLQNHERSLKEKAETVVSPSLQNHAKSPKAETEVSPSLRNHAKSPKVRENEVVIDAVLRNCKIILVIVAVILSHRIHETKNSSWI